MLGQLVAAQFDVEAAIAEVTRAGGNVGDAQNQLQFLTSLQRTVGSAGPSALAQMRAEVAATVSGAQAVVQQTRSAAGGDDKSERAMTMAEARAAIADVGRDVFGNKKLDPYLQFASEEDERAYREREAKRQQDYERERAKGTPEGDRKAAEILSGQLDDAKAHGADASPDFAALAAKTERARSALAESEQAPSLTANTTKPAKNQPAPADDLDGALAALRAAGVTPPTAEQPASGHGLTTKITTASLDRGANRSG